MASVKERATAGFMWNFLEQFLSKGVVTLTTIALAWFLVPEDYALVSMLAVFISLSLALVDGGLTQALIRKKNVEEIELDTVFVLNIVIAVIIYILVYFFAVHVASFYEEERLTSLIRVVSISVFFQALYLVPKAILVRELEFRKQLKIVLPATVLSSALAIFLAYNGVGVWALIFQIVLNNALIAAFYLVFMQWRPQARFSIGVLREYWGFSSYILSDSLIAIPFRNMYLIVLPKYFLAGPAGLYFFADKIKEIILQLTVQTVMKITYPAFSKLQGDDIRLKEGFRSVILCTTFLVFPIMVFVSALAPLIFDVLLPEKWLGASIFLQLMCLASMMNPLNALNLNIMKVKGRADLVFYVGIYKKVVSILILCFTLQFTIEIILFGQIVASVINYIPNAFFSSRLIDYKILEQISDVLPAFLLSFFVGLLVYVGQYIVNFSGIFYLLFSMLFSILAYVTASYFFRLRSFKLVKDIFFSKFKIS